VDSNLVRVGFGVLFPIKPFPVTGRKNNQGTITDINPKINPDKIDVSKIPKNSKKK
jgi:hypothetical protein